MSAADKIEISTDKHDWRPSPLPGQVVLVTTIGSDGLPNVAPKSWISMAAFGPPPILMFGCNLAHATALNVLARREFVVNVPGQDLTAVCWAVGTDTSTQGAARFERHKLTPVPALRVKARRIAECRAHLECELDGVREWGREIAVFGRVLAVSVDGRLLEGDAQSRYAALAPFFFLESRLSAGLGPVRPVG